MKFRFKYRSSSKENVTGSRYSSLNKFNACDIFHNLSFVLVFSLIFHTCTAAYIGVGEQCDWTGSGLEMNGGKWTDETKRGITPVYVRCNQGRVSWVYPRGGLRVLLRLGSSGKDFRGCIKVNPTFAGARIFHDARNHLKELYSPDDRLPVKLPRCFHSKDGQAALYVEEATPSAVGNDLFPKYFAEFSYDLEAVRPNAYDADERCKPCDREELMRAFCTNDLVVSGSIEAIHHEEDMDVSEISVRVEKFLKDSSFEGSSSDDEKRSKGENEVESGGGGSSSDTYVTITMPKMCQSKPGAGQFVFMARKRFDDYSLVCAPRWEEWKQLVRHENQIGGSHCVLSY